MSLKNNASCAFSRMVSSLVFFLAARQHTLTFHFAWSVPGFLALLAGVLALLRPKNFNQIVAGYLILLGLVEILGVGF